MNPKKIMILCGSPRPKGNTHTLADWTAEGAKSAGAEVEKIDVTRLRYASYGCTSCYGWPLNATSNTDAKKETPP
jgi:multimeric flavodoxin WrbA